MTSPGASGAYAPTGASDVRLRGFSHRASFDDATRWIDAHGSRLPDGEIEAARGLGRVLAVSVHAPLDLPPADQAHQDGYAVRAAETAGASDYNPLSFAIVPTCDGLPASAVALVVAGGPLPEGADAILSFGSVQRSESGLDVFEALAQGAGVEARAECAAAGTLLLEPGRILGAQDLGMLAGLGVRNVQVVGQPRVALIIAGPKPPADPAHDANGPLLQALIERDGGIISSITLGPSTRGGVMEAVTKPQADLVLIVGRTGVGSDDEAPLALAAAGSLAVHGIALRPGGSAGLGIIGSTPVILLPGDPLACLCTYEMLAGRLIRSLGGREVALPHPVRAVELGHKIVSSIGSVDMFQVKIVEGRAEPVGSPDSGGLVSALRADGFVVVPASLEGYGPGTRVTVHLYRQAHAGAPDSRSAPVG